MNSWNNLFSRSLWNSHAVDNSLVVTFINASSISYPVYEANM